MTKSASDIQDIIERNIGARFRDFEKAMDDFDLDHQAMINVERELVKEYADAVSHLRRVLQNHMRLYRGRFNGTELDELGQKTSDVLISTSHFDSCVAPRRIECIGECTRGTSCNYEKCKVFYTEVSNAN